MASLSRKHAVGLIMVALLTLIPLLVSAEAMFSGGPPDGETGAPGETDCTRCHAGGPDDGTLAISGVPQFYELGTTYTVTVTLQDPGQSRWGFELTAVGGDGNGAGVFTITDGVNTQLSDNAEPARDYVKHTSTGTYAGTSNGPVTWDFDWTSPVSDAGDITFYVAGNAANNNGNTSGDNVYTNSYSTTLDVIPSMSSIGLLILTVMLVVSSLIVLRRKYCLSR